MIKITPRIDKKAANISYLNMDNIEAGSFILFNGKLCIMDTSFALTNLATGENVVYDEKDCIPIQNIVDVEIIWRRRAVNLCSKKRKAIK